MILYIILQLMIIFSLENYRQKHFMFFQIVCKRILKNQLLKKHYLLDMNYLLNAKIFPLKTDYLLVNGFIENVESFLDICYLLKANIFLYNFLFRSIDSVLPS